MLGSPDYDIVASNATQARIRFIEATLRNEGSVKVRHLAATLGISEVTVRRYLDQMVARGQIERSRGGAVLLDAPLSDPLFSARRAAQRQSKTRIARFCADWLPHIGSVFLGAAPLLAKLQSA